MDNSLPENSPNSPAFLKTSILIEGASTPPKELAIFPAMENAASPQNDPVLEATFHALAGQLAASSRRQYQSDAKHFALWLSRHSLTLEKVSRDDIIEYRLHLAESYPVAATASRLLVVAKRLLDEAVKRGALNANPAADIKGFKTGGDNENHSHRSDTFSDQSPSGSG